MTIAKNLTLNGTSSGNSDNPTVVPPARGLVANTTDPANAGAPVAAQIAVLSPATSVIIEHMTVDGIGNGMAGCANPLMVGIDYLDVSGTITQNALGTKSRLTRLTRVARTVWESMSRAETASLNHYNLSDTVHKYQKNGITVNGFGIRRQGPSRSSRTIP